MSETLSGKKLVIIPKWPDNNFHKLNFWELVHLVYGIINASNLFSGYSEGIHFCSDQNLIKLQGKENHRVSSGRQMVDIKPLEA